MPLTKNILRTDPFQSVLVGLLASDALLALSGMFGYVALPWWIIHRGGASDLAIYGVSIALATVFAMPLISPLGDRYPKRMQIVLGVVVLAFIAAGQAMLVAVAYYRLEVIVGIGLVTVIANAFVRPASETISAEIVPAHRLTEMLRLRKSAQATGSILGPALAGMTLALAGTAATFCLNGMLLGIAAWLASRLPSTARPRWQRRGIAHWWADLRAGLTAKWVVPLERGWTLVNFLVWIFQGPAVGMLIPLKVKSLGLSSMWLGVSEAALSVGLLIGTFRGSDFLVRLYGRFNVRVGAAMCEGLALAATGWAHAPLMLVSALVCAGFANASMGLVGATHRSLAIPADFRVRIFAASVMTTQIAGALGPALAGAALTHWATSQVYIAFGIATCVLAFGFVLVPRSREFFLLSHDEVKDWFRNEYPDAFKTR